MKILYFDIAAMMILAVIMISLIFRKMLSGRANRFYAVLLIHIIITTIVDFWAESYGVWIPATESNMQPRLVGCYLYFFLRNLTTPLYHLFICAVTDTWHILKKSKSLKAMLIIPYAIICMTLFSNLFTHRVFYFDENLVYHRGAILYVLYAASFFYLICGVIYLIRYKKMLTSDKFVALMLMYPLNVLAIIIQLFWSQFLVEMFMTSLTMLLVALVIQRPEQIINPVLGVRSYISYTMDMKQAFSIQKPVRIIFAKLVNYEALSSILEYDNCMQLLRSIASDLALSYKAANLPMDLYYVENGLFALVTENEQSQQVQDIAKNISEKMTAEKQIKHLQVEPESCVCIIRCPQDIDNYETLLTFGNTFHTYLPHGKIVNDMAEEKDRRMFQLRGEIDSIISDAVANQRFMMYYQPIYSTKEKRFLSAEALIRLKDEKYGFISPELFITAAEKNGMILQIGDFVLDEVCGFLARCEKDGLPMEYIELNLSMNQCMQANLKEKVLYYMNKYDLRPDQINLEITETAANKEQDIVAENIRELSKEGINFSLDDYGTGYSNLSRIMELPFHIIKLDKSLADRVNDSRIKVLIKNTIQMLQEIGMEIVVEGVETEETLQQFLEMGCDYIQGFYYSKPLPEQEFVKYVWENEG
ncbi:MAG: EAL domain-containing protein [bacterium]|nr:EAL domain-containing protein [bacterium]